MFPNDLKSSIMQKSVYPRRPVPFWYKKSSQLITPFKNSNLRNQGTKTWYARDGRRSRLKQCGIDSHANLEPCQPRAMSAADAEKYSAQSVTLVNALIWYLHFLINQLVTLCRYALTHLSILYTSRSLLHALYLMLEAWARTVHPPPLS